MKNTLIATVAALMLTSLTAQAQVTKTLSCDFTEPFFTLNVDLKTKEISRTEPDWENGGQGQVTTVVARGIELRVDNSDALAPKYQIVEANGAVFAELALDMNGSDGMSDNIYPFSIVHQQMYGGCESDKLKKFNPNY